MRLLLLLLTRCQPIPPRPLGARPFCQSSTPPPQIPHPFTKRRTLRGPPRGIGSNAPWRRPGSNRNSRRTFYGSSHRRRLRRPLQQQHQQQVHHQPQPGSNRSVAFWTLFPCATTTRLPRTEPTSRQHNGPLFNTNSRVPYCCIIL